MAAAVALACGRMVGVAAGEADRATVDAAHQTLFAGHCLRCHDAAKQEGGVRLDDLPSTIDSLVVAERWQRVLDVLNSGDMPPAGQTPLPAEAKTELLASLSEAMVVARRTIGDQGQTAALRRLNRREYVNTIRDLLDVETEALGLPDDSGTGTYDTFGSSLFMSSDQIRRYLENGRLAVSLAMQAIDDASREPPARQSQRTEVEVQYRGHLSHLLRGAIIHQTNHERWKASKGKSPKEFGFPDEAAAKFADRFDVDGRTLAMYLSLKHVETGAYLTNARHSPTVRIDVPKSAPPGEYLLRARCGIAENMPPEERFLEVLVNEGNATVGEVFRTLGIYEVLGGVPGHAKGPQVVEVPVRITSDGTRTFFFQQKRYASKDIDWYKFAVSRRATGFGPPPALWVDWLEWDGPLPDPRAPERAPRLLGSRTPDETDDAAREILTAFATRAFRGVAPQAEFIDRLVAIQRERHAAGESFRASLVEPMAVVLASPGFLYLHEPPTAAAKGSTGPAQPAADRRLSDLELASRIAYFLWSAPPDDELITAAIDGALRDPDRLRQQVDRLLASPRSYALARGFTHQWLSMDRLDFFKFNYAFYPDFDEPTRELAKQEVYRTFDTLVRENIDARRLIKNDFVVVDAVMASFYGLTEEGKPINGMHFRKVALPADSPRGGLMGMAAILGMGSNGERTSPVERGAWILRKLLHDPPPPAPPNVPQLSRLDGKPLSPKERLRLHQEEPQCAQCHRRIDPLGFALECFDASGKFRTVDEEKKWVPAVSEVSVAHTWPLETAGELRDGTPFKDYFELRDRVAERGDAFLTGLVENLFQYAVGRPASFADAEGIRGVMARAKASGGGLRDIVHEIVQAPEFQTK
ncbi:MAG: DUF1592 domain-containing protein [Pirellulales bacterium]